jgi:ribosome-associated heat shock protein Hsp15
MNVQRIDKWLWAARFYKTRSIASDEIGKNRVQVNGQDAKPSKEVKPGIRCVCAKALCSARCMSWG